MHSETSKFKQSVLTLVSPVSSIGITDNKIIYITPTMILYEDMKPVITINETDWTRSASSDVRSNATI